MHKKRTLLLTSAASYLLLIAGLIYVGIQLNREVTSFTTQTNLLYEHPFQVNASAREARFSISSIRNNILYAIVDFKNVDCVSLENKIKGLDNKLDGELLTIEQHFLGDMNKVREARELIKTWRQYRGELIILLKNGHNAEMHQLLLAQITPSYEALKQRLDYVVDFSSAKAMAIVETSRQQADQVRTKLLLLLIVFALFTFLLVYFINRSLKQRVETMAAQSSSRYARSLLEASLDPLVTISTTGKIMDVNKATETATGLERDELIGSDFSEYFTKPEMALEGYQKVFLHGEVKDYPLAIQHKDGHVIDVMYNATVYRDEAGEVSGVFAAARDVTLRKRAEQQLQKANDELETRVETRTRELSDANNSLQEAYEKLQQSKGMLVRQEKLAAMGILVGGVSHEVNNPLMGITNYIEYVRDHIAEHRSREMLGKALHEVERIRQLVRSMLIYAHPPMPDVQSAEIPEVLLRVVTLIEGERKYNDVRFCLDLPPNLPKVNISPDVLQQILLNLLINALYSLKSSAPPRQVVISAKATIDAVELQVHDNGPGVADELRDKIFDPFFTTKPPGEGTGLGLAISRQMAETVDSKLELTPATPGACFRLTMPISRQL